MLRHLKVSSFKLTVDAYSIFIFKIRLSKIWIFLMAKKQMSALINNLYSLSYNVMNLIQKEKKLGNKK